MRGFRQVDGDAVAELDDYERAAVVRLVADVGALLADDDGADEAVSGPGQDAMWQQLNDLGRRRSEPEDPALRRLLPAASHDDGALAEDFRNLTEGAVRMEKVQRLHAVRQQLSQDRSSWRVPLDQVMATAAALTDVRLVVASRLDIATDDDADRLADELDQALRAGAVAYDGEPGQVTGIAAERLWLGMVYQALTYLQESLVQVALETECHDE